MALSGRGVNGEAERSVGVAPSVAVGAMEAGMPRAGKGPGIKLAASTCKQVSKGRDSPFS